MIELISQRIPLNQNTGQLIVYNLILFEKPDILVEIKVKGVRNGGMSGKVELRIRLSLKFPDNVKTDFIHWYDGLFAFNLVGVMILKVFFGSGQVGFCCHKNIFCLMFIIIYF